MLHLNLTHSHLHIVKLTKIFTNMEQDHGIDTK